MAEKYTSKIALILDDPVEDVGEVVAAAVAAGDIDRDAPVGDGLEARQVNWGGRMAKAVVRAVTDEEDDVALLRTEAAIGGDGLVGGMTRQAGLLQGLARVLRTRVRGVRDISARTDHDVAWLNRIAIGSVELADAVNVVTAGTGTYWVHSFGAARFDIPDIELYGLPKAKTAAATAAVEHVIARLLRRGLKSELTLPSGEAVYLVPVLEAWQNLNLDWPGIGRAGRERGPGLNGPRATLSLLHPPRFGKWKKDFNGVVKALG